MEGEGIGKGWWEGLKNTCCWCRGEERMAVGGWWWVSQD